MQTARYPFERVAEAIRAAIADGHLAPRQELPTEHELAHTHGTGRSTIRRALDVLSAEGLIDRHQGKRATVRPTPLVRIHGDGTDWKRHRQAGRPGFDGTVAEHGLTPRQEILDVTDPATAPTHIAVALGVQPDEPMVMRYIRQYADDVPVRLVRSWFPATWASGTALAERRLIRGGAAALIEDPTGPIRRHLADSEVELEGRNPTRTEKDLLSLATGVTVMHVTRVFYDNQEVPVFAQEEVADASRHRYRFRVPL